MATYLVAVSGGIDSVVLLHQLSRLTHHKIIVAHFDHGIRPDSHKDAEFVRKLAEHYQLECVIAREELGPHASEAEARERRYTFLREQAAAHNALLMTAHHSDDVIETIAINLIRGTGWRGLAVFDNPDVKRPLLAFRKQAIKHYGAKHQLAWVEDATNSTDAYLRNRVREALNSSLSEDDRQQLLRLWERQKELKEEIEVELARLSGPSPYSRYQLTQIDEAVAQELIRHVVKRQTDYSPTRPQLARALLMVKTAKPGALFELGGGITLSFTLREFIVETL